VMILSTVAVQAWADIARRDSEAEMIFRAQDIVRALKRFQLEKGKLPTELKELMEPGNKGQFFLRRLWKDPLVKGGQWQYLYAGPAGGLFDPTAEGAPGVPGLPGAVAPPGLPPPASGLQQTGQQPTGPQGNQPGAFPPFASIGKLNDGSSETTGLPIAGVKSRCKDRPFRRYKDKSMYSEWTFSIFDLDPHPPPVNTPAVNQQNRTGAPFPPPGTGVPPPNPNNH